MCVGVSSVHRPGRQPCEFEMLVKALQVPLGHLELVFVRLTERGKLIRFAKVPFCSREQVRSGLI